MAEFQEVMKQWRRFCKSHSNCGECEFDGKGICCETHLSGVPYSDIELRIMSWAAEHPVVYPTWGEYLASIGVMKPAQPDKAYEVWLTQIYSTTIPDDIAQKLGIAPKEN